VYKPQKLHARNVANLVKRKPCPLEPVVSVLVDIGVSSNNLSVFIIIHPL
jgi:hypothetical protein